MFFGVFVVMDSTKNGVTVNKDGDVVSQSSQSIMGWVCKALRLFASFLSFLRSCMTYGAWPVKKADPLAGHSFQTPTIAGSDFQSVISFHPWIRLQIYVHLVIACFLVGKEISAKHIRGLPL